MDTVLQDLRHGARSLLRQPSFSALAIVTLALGIGANAAMFTVVDAVLLRPLRFPHPDRIVSLTNLWIQRGTTGSVSAPDFHDWHDSTRSFAAMGYYTFTSESDTSVGVDGAPGYAAVTLVSPEFFDVFATPTVVGRTFSTADAATPLSVISHEFWMQRFNGRTDVVGQSIDVARRSIPIVGIMPPGFAFPGHTQVWVSSALLPETTSRSAHNYRVVALLKDGTSLAAAKAELSAVMARLEAAYPNTNAGKSATAIPLQEQLVGDTRGTLLMLFGVVALVLVIACANVANLLLARATERATELAVRAALGAGRRRLIAQLMTEGGLLAVASGAAGLLLARLGVGLFATLAPPGLPRLDEVHVDARVLVFSLLLSLAASMVFSVMPALQATRVDLNASLRHGGRGATASTSGRYRALLVVAELALAVALVTGASLLVRSFIALARVDLGFGVDHRLVVETTIPYNGVADARGATATYADVLEELGRVPGVVSLAGIRGLPATSMHSNGGYWIDGGPGPDATGVRAPQAVFTVVTPKYFQTMDIPLHIGRDFDARDGYEAPRVAIVNDAVARQAFPNSSPIGRQIMCGLDELRFMTIVGVVGNVREYDPSTAPLPEIYMPYQQHPTFGASLRLVARTTVEPLAVAKTIREAIRQIDPEMPVRTTTMEGTLSAAVATPRFRTTLVSGFAALALVLAIGGVYGVMAYLVSRRTSEIGVRMAVGATPLDIQRLVVGQGMRLAMSGIATGSLLAYVLAKSLRGMLFGVTATDPLVFALVALVLLITAAAATAIPAMRAARLDPIAALRAD